ncbi:Holliday junction resolvase RuvX [Fulvivirga lutea]|uniref:Putative pre-16S rRNA nuclease n=1 Tax=Fulvivirga lutea TaxID=2810512 RepID=A0A975A150_9BACT|nr:Holliday junction resolvase RuvX [Fulvivirga lutea]QSE97926.1 Holliday junction resolvase RuvX [Fulvivirga lutea]
MGRILSIDYGIKRVGLAVTDPLKMIASPLETIESNTASNYIKAYCQREDVERIIIGMPKDLQNKDTHSTDAVRKFIIKLQKELDSIPITEVDERFTSKMAFQTMIDGGLKKKDRKNKGTIDKVSATIILQSYLDSNPTI